MSGPVEPEPLEVRANDLRLSGEAQGSGPSVVLCHGLTATRRYVLHGSTALARRGFRTIAYDARGHGRSDPAGADDGYSYAELAADLKRVIASTAADGAVLAGHSMGAHTIASLAGSEEARADALILIGPAWATPTPPDELERWDALADGLDRGGVEGFIEVYDDGLDPEWRQTLIRVARDRLGEHRDPGAVARAIREVPRSDPLDSLADLEAIAVPTLVVASRDESDPGHPRSVAEAWAERIPQAELAIEDEGASPLAWQGGRLAREIARFLSERL